MADETVLESLVVRLTGDGSMYQKMLEQAGQATKAASTVVEAGTKAFDQLHATLSSGVTAVASYIASWSAFSRLEGMFNLAGQREESEIRLRAAVKSHGMEVESTVKRLKDYAASLSAVTTHGNDEIIHLEKSALGYGLTGDHIMSATKAALALSDATEIGAEGAMRMAQAMEQGDIKKAMAFGRMIKELRGVKDATEFQTKYNALINQGLETQVALASSVGGQITRLSNAWKSLQKDLGDVVALAVEPAIQGVVRLVKWFQDLSPAAKEAIVVVAGVAAGVVSLTGAIAVAGVVFNVAFGGSGILIGLITTGLVAAAGGAALLVRDFGGVAPMMDYLKKKATEFWDWIAPVRTALGSLFGEFIDQAGKLWGSVKSGAGGILQSIFGDVNWDDVRTKIVGAITAAEQVIRNFGTTAGKVWEDFSGWAAMAAKAVGPVVEWVQRAIITVRQMAYDNRGLILTIVGVAAAFKVVQLGIAGTMALLQILHADQIVSIATWVAWGAAVVAVKGTVAIFTGVLNTFTLAERVFNATMTAAGAVIQFVSSLIGVTTVVANTAAAASTAGLAVATLATSASMTTLTVSTSLTAIAMSALSAAVLSLAPSIAAVAVTGGILVAAFAGIWGAAAGVIGVVTDLFDLLTTSSAISKALEPIGAMFGGWWKMIQSIISAAQKDMPLAWEMAKIGAFIAIEEIYVAWQSLFPLLQEGFDTLWAYVQSSFAAHFYKGVDDAMDYLAAKTDPLGLSTEQIAKHQKKTLDEMNANLAFATNAAAHDLRNVADKFKPDFDTGTIRQYKREFQKLKDEVANMPDPESKWKNLFDKLTPPVSKTKDEIDKHMDVIAKGVKEGREKVDFVLAGSVEAALHVAEYRATLEMAFDQSKKGHGPGDEEGHAGGGVGGGGAGLLTPSVAPSPGLPSGAGIETATEKTLKMVLEVLQAMAAKDGKLPVAHIAP